MTATDEQSAHTHVVLPRGRPGDTKRCACGQRRDPVTQAWMTDDDHAQLISERAERRARYGADGAEQYGVMQAMNRSGL